MMALHKIKTGNELKWNIFPYFQSIDNSLLSDRKERKFFNKLQFRIRTPYNANTIIGDLNKIVKLLSNQPLLLQRSGVSDFYTNF